MTTNNKSVKIFMIPQQFPCGPQSSCCGPVGQSEEEVQSLKSILEKEIGCRVEVINIINGGDMGNHPQVLRLVQAFGSIVLPIIALDGEVVSIGNPTPEQAVSAIREKMTQSKE